MCVEPIKRITYDIRTVAITKQPALDKSCSILKFLNLVESGVLTINHATADLILGVNLFDRRVYTQTKQINTLARTNGKSIGRNGHHKKEAVTIVALI